jgi:hypothetical protein
VNGRLTDSECRTEKNSLQLYMHPDDKGRLSANASELAEGRWGRPQGYFNNSIYRSFPRAGVCPSDGRNRLNTEVKHPGAGKLFWWLSLFKRCFPPANPYPLRCMNGILSGSTDSYQVNFRLPSGITSGQASIQVSAAWIAGPEVRIPVREWTCFLQAPE